MFPVEPMQESAWVCYSWGDRNSLYISLFIVVDIDEDFSLNRL